MEKIFKIAEMLKLKKCWKGQILKKLRKLAIIYLQKQKKTVKMNFYAVNIKILKVKTKNEQTLDT